MSTDRISLHLSLPLLSLCVGLAGAPSAYGQSTGQLFASVTDQAGDAVIGLTADSFQVEEDGVAMTLVTADPGTTPMKVALLVDNSEPIASSNGLSSLRNGVAAFLDELPPQHEVGLFPIAGSVMRVVDFTTDRADLLHEADGLGNGRGGAKMVEGVMETWDRRFEDGDVWPVMVLVLTDGPESSRNVNPDEFNEFVIRLINRGAMIHAVLLETRGGGLQTQLAANLSKNTGGLLRTLNSPTGLPDALRQLATRMGSHFDDMSTRYRLVFERPGKTPGTRMSAGIVGPSCKLQLFTDRRMPSP
ncbi:MAG: hypothetical protein CL477_16420 [Acidobacteria bacterium]|jgi:hypothetical protein|nr:hypothetical protein [Acidobacteriota bacterium]HJN46552.1 VWA domain-containing protein [Vicinamibacterales bacterium]|tara:strand:- start:5411 stop:6319 length:909 start_codon:yes stop_codon:yes gene_type:complete